MKYLVRFERTVTTVERGETIVEGDPQSFDAAENALARAEFQLRTGSLRLVADPNPETEIKPSVEEIR